MKTSLAFKVAHFANKSGVKPDILNNPAVIYMRQELELLGKGGVRFEISVYADGSWSARSVNVDGIITGGINQSDMIETIKDAVFTYYDISPQFCDDSLLRGTGEKKTVKNEIYVTV